MPASWIEVYFARGLLVRVAAWAVAPAFAGPFMGASLALPFLVGAGMKVGYDILLWVAFRGRTRRRK